MILSLSFKTPDVLHYALEDINEDERAAAKTVAEKFLEWGECIVVDIDIETETATVRKR